MVLSIVLFSVFGYERGEFASDLFTAVNGFVMIYGVIKLYRDVSKTIKIIFIGLSILLFGVANTFILNLIQTSDWHVVFYQTGFFIELIFFTIAINYTYFVERNARVKAMLDLSMLETKRLKSEKEALALRNEVDYKNRNLTQKAVEITKHNQIIQS